MKEETTGLLAGAARATICFPPAMFPTWEGYTGVHDDPCVRALLLKTSREAFALVSFDLISINTEVEAYRQMAQQMTGIPAKNVWICVSHTLPTPHFWLKPEDELSDEERRKNRLMHQTIEEAYRRVLTEACQSIRPALFGFGVGSCAVNINRNVTTRDGVWLGSNEEGEVDRSVSVFRFDGVDGSTIALLFNYNAQASVMDGACTAAGDRLVSADLAGASSAFVEKHYSKDVVAMYCLGAGGDQAPSMKALRTVVGRNGDYWLEDAQEKGYLLMEIQGERLGQQVILTAEKIRPSPLEHMRLDHRVYRYRGQHIPDTASIKPHKEYAYQPADDVETAVELMVLKGVALVGIRPEIDCKTLLNIKKQSPFQSMALMTFVNGGAKYLCTKDKYQQVTYQSMNSRYYCGAAEQLAKDVVNLLMDAYAEAHAACG